MYSQASLIASQPHAILYPQSIVPESRLDLWSNSDKRLTSAEVFPADILSTPQLHFSHGPLYSPDAPDATLARAAPLQSDSAGRAPMANVPPHKDGLGTVAVGTVPSGATTPTAHQPPSLWQSFVSMITPRTAVEGGSEQATGGESEALTKKQERGPVHSPQVPALALECLQSGSSEGQENERVRLKVSGPLGTVPGEQQQQQQQPQHDGLIETDKHLEDLKTQVQTVCMRSGALCLYSLLGLCPFSCEHRTG